CEPSGGKGPSHKKEPGKAKEVTKRRQRPLPARDKCHVARPPRPRRAAGAGQPLCQTTGIVKTVHPGPPVSLVARDNESRVDHSERTKDPALEHVAERGVLHSRDQKSKKIGRM